MPRPPPSPPLFPYRPLSRSAPAARQAEAAGRRGRAVGVASLAAQCAGARTARGGTAQPRDAQEPRAGRALMRALGPVLAVLVVIALLASSAMYTVDQRQNAIVFQLGEAREIVKEPGLHFKWPLLQNVRLFDMRILTFDDAEPLRFLTQGNRPLLVDSFVKWRIADVLEYYKSVQGDEFRAQTRIKQTVSGVLRDEFGARILHDVVSGEREQIMSRVREKVDQDLKRIGVVIIDVRLKRVDLPQDVSESVYRRMEIGRAHV